MRLGCLLVSFPLFSPFSLDESGGLSRVVKSIMHGGLGLTFVGLVCGDMVELSSWWRAT